MLPAACLAHPWITQHRAKALAAANSTKPVAEGAKIDNRLMRRYNARRKFRVSLRYYFHHQCFTGYSVSVTTSSAKKRRRKVPSRMFGDPSSIKCICY